MVENLTSEILVKLETIYNTVTLNESKIESLGLFDGKLGICLFKFYYLLYKNEPTDEALNILSGIYSKIANIDMVDEIFLLNCSEFGCMVQYLQINMIISQNFDEILSDFDSILKSSLDACLNNSNYSLFYGAMNFVQYFLFRFKATKRKQYFSYLESFVLILWEKSVFFDKNKISWRYILSHKLEEDGFNLTFIYGHNSIIHILSNLYLMGVKPNLTAKMIRYACNYELYFKQNSIESQIIFPIGIRNDFTAIRGNLIPMNWNVGDLMIGYNLLFASRSLSNKRIEKQAIDIIDSTLSRSSCKAAMVNNYTLLNGSVGIALIYNLVYRMTLDEKYKKAALKWYKEALNGISVIGTNNVEISLTCGLSGVGICLIDFLMCIFVFGEDNLILV